MAATTRPPTRSETGPRRAPPSPERQVGGSVGAGDDGLSAGSDDGSAGRQPGLGPSRLRIVMLYDMDACHGPTGVTRHALAQLERLARREDVALRLISGRMIHPDGLAYWAALDEPLAARAADPDARPPAVVAAQGLAADRVVFGPGRLDLLSDGVRRAGATGPDGGDQPRRVAASAVPAPQESRAPGQRLRQGRPDPLGLGVQHPPAHRGVSRVQGSSGPGSQRGRGPVLRAGQPARARAGAEPTWGCRPGFLISFRWRISSRGRTSCG